MSCSIKARGSHPAISDKSRSAEPPRNDGGPGVRNRAALNATETDGFDVLLRTDNNKGASSVPLIDFERLGAGELTRQRFAAKSTLAECCQAPHRALCPGPRQGTATQDSRFPAAIGLYGDRAGRPRDPRGEGLRPLQQRGAHRRTAGRFPFVPTRRRQSATSRSARIDHASPATSPTGDRAMPRSRLARGWHLPHRANRTGRGNKEIGERHVDSIADKAAHAGRVIALPYRIRRQRHVRRPSGDRTGWDDNRVADRLVPTASPIEHACEHRHIEICVIVDGHSRLPS